ncbi:serine hydrolase domain-containing protein [Anaeroselena agilis]|uniref:Serine hydrolase domain-containing protein n=1 Tax=Anaeroselena agilis TaxID=3063788 RepID=A0ABU3P4P8_9FIRM|nr:serine hydrolase domain-containing protein [Selenomonadales bacterium 4137-cl]
MMRHFVRVGWLLVCLLLAGMPLAAAMDSDATDAKAVARTEIWKDIAAGATGNAAVAIMDGGEIVYSEGFGMADRAGSIPVDRYTIFNMGSVSKVYAATAIMLLVDEGKVELDQPVTRYLPEFKMADERYKDITVRMTLNHASGIPGTTGANNFGFAYNKDVYKDTLDALALSDLKHRPGEMNPYCNDGFTLAEMIVVRVSGQSFPDFLNERIFKPLGIGNTGPSVGMRPETKKVKAARYYPPGRLNAEPLEVISLLGAGGLSASAEDLCRFADSFSGKGPQVLSARALAEMKKAQPPEFSGKLRGPDVSWGLGWDVTDHERYRVQGIKVLGKSGGTGTYTTMMFAVPDRRIAVAVIATGARSGAVAIADKVLEAYLADKGLMKKEARAVTPPVKAEPIPAGLKAYEGYYYGGVLMRMAFDTEKGTLTVYKVEDQAETTLLTAKYNGGYFHTDGGKLYFAVVDGRRYFVKHDPDWMVDTISGEKVEPVASPVRLGVEIEGREWLRRNAKAFEGMMAADGNVVESRLVPALPGYVVFGGLMRVESPIFAAMPVKSMRDLAELRLVDRDGGLWAWCGGALYMPGDMAATLTGGEGRLVIGKEGYNEWLKVTEDCVLSFAKPAKGRVMVYDAEGKLLYDSVMDSGEVFVGAGGFVALTGNAGDAFTVMAKSGN